MISASCCWGLWPSNESQEGPNIFPQFSCPAFKTGCRSSWHPFQKYLWSPWASTTGSGFMENKYNE
jgi:hypothetical protein